MKINKLYIDKFKLLHNEYLYPVKKGIYLAFDKDTFDYIGVELFYLIKYGDIEKDINDTLHKLMILDYIDVTL